jgi:hypothetical protein
MRRKRPHVASLATTVENTICRALRTPPGIAAHPPATAPPTFFAKPRAFPCPFLGRRRLAGLTRSKEDVPRGYLLRVHDSGQGLTILVVQ